MATASIDVRFAAALPPPLVDFAQCAEDVLVNAAARGDRAAFQEIINQHGDGVFRLAFRMTRSQEDAHEVFQNTFLKAMTAIRKFRGHCKLKSWLYRIASNFSIAILRERTAQLNRFGLDSRTEEGPEPIERLTDSRAEWNPERKFFVTDISYRIRTALGNLTQRERSVFELRHFEGLKLREVGFILGTSEETAKNTFYRANQKLRQQLNGCL